MPLLPIFKSSPDQVYSLQLGQIVALCGNGNLRDNSECAVELREYLSQAPSGKIIEYIEACLKTALDHGGFVLQDLVNELGRRLDYRVENGLYQGRSSAIGYDGIWYAPDESALIIEVKTTDAYRINLDTAAQYRKALIESGKISAAHSSVLIVVGRQDTGDLEAQVRGSKHAWDIRLLSIDGLVKLVRLKEETEEETVTKIHELLVPFEYTRLDKIIDVVFTAAKDAGAVIQQETLTNVMEEDSVLPSIEQDKQAHTPPEVLSALRERIIAAVGKKENSPLIRKSTALYWNTGKTLRVVCSISKRHSRGFYWYAYHPSWDQFLSEASKGLYVLGCVGRNDAYALPFEWIHAKLENMYTTEREDKKYWHVHLEETETQIGEMTFLVGKLGQKISISTFRIDLR